MSERMERDSIPLQKARARARGMSYGQYVAARYYPVVIVEPVAGGEHIVHRAAVPEVLPGRREPVQRNGGADRSGGAEDPAQKEGTGRKCAVCGVELEEGKRTYCGEVCKKKAASQRYNQRKKAGQIKLPPKLVLEPRECAVCGQRFEPVTRHQKYCGQACSLRALREGNRLRWVAEKELKPKKRCIACGAELSGRQIKYCAGCSIREKNRQNRERNRKEAAITAFENQEDGA